MVLSTQLVDGRRVAIPVHRIGAVVEELDKTLRIEDTDSRGADTASGYECWHVTASFLEVLRYLDEQGR